MSTPQAPVPAPAHHAATHHGGDAGGDDGDDPGRPRKGPQRAHEVDGPPGDPPRQKKAWLRRRRPDGAPDVTDPCSVCSKRFWSPKALHGHMRTHPERDWRGVLPPDQRPPKRPNVTKEAATLLIKLSEGPNNGPRQLFICHSCGRDFGTRQALGGHRATHKNVKGCYALEKDERESSNPAQGSGGGAQRVGKGKARVEEQPTRRRQTSKAGTSRPKKGKGVQIDLNLPAPEDDKDEESSPGVDLNGKLGD